MPRMYTDRRSERPTQLGNAEIFGASQTVDSACKRLPSTSRLAVAHHSVGISDAVQPNQLIPRTDSLVHFEHVV